MLEKRLILAPPKKREDGHGVVNAIPCHLIIKKNPKKTSRGRSIEERKGELAETGPLRSGTVFLGRFVDPGRKKKKKIIVSTSSPRKSQIRD